MGKTLKKKDKIFILNISVLMFVRLLFLMQLLAIQANKWHVVIGVPGFKFYLDFTHKNCEPGDFN